MRQNIIAIGREFGSGGHIVAQRLAEHYGIPLYSKEMLAEIAKDGEYSEDVLERFDEKPVNLVFIPTPMGTNNISLEQGVALSEFNFLRKKADVEKESFVVLGRCAEEILSENPNLTSIFILSDKESKIKRIMEREGLDEKQAANKMKKVDKMRKTYHNFYSENKWGDSRAYDLCINTSKTGIDNAVNLIIQYVNARKNMA